MARYDFAAALFHFFTVFARRPLSVVWIAAWQLVFYAAIVITMIALFWPLTSELIEAAVKGAEPDQALILQFLGASMLATIIGTLVYLLSLVSIQAAWLRLLAKDEVKALIPLRFGADEVRLLGINIIFLIFMTFGTTAVVILFSILNAAVFAGGNVEGFGPIAAIALGNTLLALLVSIGAIFVCLRFAASPALTILQGRFNLFGGFDASKGILGWMLLTYLVAIVLIMIGGFVLASLQQVGALFMVADMIPALEKLDGVEDPQVVFTVLSEVLTQEGVLTAFGFIIATQLVFQVLLEGLWHGIGAYVARRHEGLEGETIDDTSAPIASVGSAPAEG